MSSGYRSSGARPADPRPVKGWLDKTHSQSYAAKRAGQGGALSAEGQHARALYVAVPLTGAVAACLVGRGLRGAAAVKLLAGNGMQAPRLQSS